MELRYYLCVFKRRALVIVIVAALTVAVTVTAGLFLITPVYTARATVRVIQDVGVLDLRIGVSYGEILMNTYSRILASSPILEEAAERIGSSVSVGQLGTKVDVDVIPDTELMWIVVEDEDPVFASLLANTLASLLAEQAENLYGGTSKSALEVHVADLSIELEENRQQLATLLASGASEAEVEALRSQIRVIGDAYDRSLYRYELASLNESLRANSITIIEPALLPRVPSNALGLKEIGIGLVVGLVGGIGWALVLENLDTRVHSPEQLQRLTRLPVLGTVPRGLLSLDSLEHTNGSRTSKPIEEAYRLLGINLQFLSEDDSLRTILITSVMPDKGRSMVAVNLAQVLAERGRTIFLVEGDLRRPDITSMLGMEDGGPGLGGLLTERPVLDRELLSQVVHPANQSNLFVISGGTKVVNPPTLLASPAMKELLDYLGVQGQMTLLDSPPVLGTADVSVLAPRVDGVILVVGQAQTLREQLLAGIKQLEASRARVLGIVFMSSGKGWTYE